MRWMVTGAGGMLGRDLTRLLRAMPGTWVRAFTRAELDVCDAAAVAAAVRAAQPDVVVNCAAWTDVDGAEQDEARAMAVNGTAVAGLARAGAQVGARLLQLSTDYVFDGAARTPYAEDAPTRPLNAYGRAKLAGERAALDHGHYVVRTEWLYGAHGRSFARTMATLAAEDKPVQVVDDQFGQPTWTVDLAERLILLGVGQAPPGVYHATNTGLTSWYGYARRIFALVGADPGLVEPVGTAAFPRHALRPAYSVLGHDAWRPLPPMRDWSAALSAAWPHLLAGWGGVVGQAVGVGRQ
ncbi:dTDP-4-dehydrorhamnose reductase [Nonomuraea candida]|uniref:dTDP-4-dehydrorhamnose reductase n=1 Tax=Nonomuraea candida TaxID=359159 RepID=UPI0006937D9D|nr:dTDP-4-dehydrorhamnose reductase [Nonomuraea candida]